MDTKSEGLDEQSGSRLGFENLFSYQVTDVMKISWFTLTRNEV